MNAAVEFSDWCLFRQLPNRLVGCQPKRGIQQNFHSSLAPTIRSGKICLCRCRSSDDTFGVLEVCCSVHLPIPLFAYQALGLTANHYRIAEVKWRYGTPEPRALVPYILGDPFWMAYFENPPLVNSGASRTICSSPYARALA